MDQLHRDIIALAGTMSRQEIANRLGVSRPTVCRCFAKHGIRTGNIFSHSPELVGAVLAFYETHTLQETRDAFPGTSVRSIIDRNDKKAKFDFWTHKERLMIIKAVGIKPISVLTKETKRTRSSIEKMLRNHFPCLKIKHFNGIPYRLIKDHVSLKKEDIKRYGNTYFVRWEQAFQHLDTDDQVVIDCISALAKFRRFIIDSDLA